MVFELKINFDKVLYCWAICNCFAQRLEETNLKSKFFLAAYIGFAQRHKVAKVIDNVLLQFVMVLPRRHEGHKG